MQNVFTGFLIVSLASFALGLAAFVALLNSYWRSEKHLKVFVAWLALGVLAEVVRRGLAIAGYFQADFFYRTQQYLDFFNSLFLLLAAAGLFRIIKSMDNEEPNKFTTKKRIK